MTADFLRAIQSGRTDQVVSYLDAGGDPMHVGPDGLSLVQWCAYHGDAPPLKDTCWHPKLIN